MNQGLWEEYLLSWYEWKLAHAAKDFVIADLLRDEFSNWDSSLRDPYSEVNGRYEFWFIFANREWLLDKDYNWRNFAGFDRVELL